jgi:beta-glucosidase
LNIEIKTYTFLILILCAFQSCGNTSPWKASYYSNPSLRGNPLFVQYEDEVVHDWSTNSPAEGIPPDFFSVRWETRLKILSPSTLKFKTKADDSVIILLDGREFHRSSSSDIKRVVTSERYFETGEYTLTVEYLEIKLSANIELRIEADKVKGFVLQPVS